MNFCLRTHEPSSTRGRSGRSSIFSKAGFGGRGAFWAGDRSENRINGSQNTTADETALRAMARTKA